MHSYKNPSKTQDLGHVEAQVTKGKKYYDDQGWEISAPISDRECIYKCLDNCESTHPPHNFVLMFCHD